MVWVCEIRLKGRLSIMRFFLSNIIFMVGAGLAFSQSPSRIPAEGGDIVITPIIHSSVQVEHAGRVIQVDPWSVGDLTG